MKKEPENKYALYFTKEEVANSNIRAIIKKLIDMKMNMQKYRDFIEISPAEFEIISKLGEFVDKSKYHSDLIFKGEVGKIKGKRLVVK